jgi:4-hydroxy-tetrahydrodipicolinate synthase
MPRFGAVITAMVTPFDDDGAVDLEGAATLARWLVANGSDGLVLTGTTGEVSVLPDEEHVAVWSAVREAVDVPLLAGSGTNDTAHAAELTARAAGHGMDGVLLVTPYYNRPSQAGLEAHFRTVAAATDLPVVLYDIPVRTGRKIATKVLLRLAEVDNIVGVKDAAGNPPETARLIAQAPEGFEVYSGDDAMTLPLLAVGAVGVISVCSHWAGPLMGRMLAAHGAGDVAEAARCNAELIASYDFESSDEAPNPVPAKAMLRALGLPAGHCRPPHAPPPEGLEARALELWHALGNEGTPHV